MADNRANSRNSSAKPAWPSPPQPAKAAAAVVHLEPIRVPTQWMAMETTSLDRRLPHVAKVECIARVTQDK